jgi:hypothetical protein
MSSQRVYVSSPEYRKYNVNIFNNHMNSQALIALSLEIRTSAVWCLIREMGTGFREEYAVCIFRVPYLPTYVP